MGLRDAPAHRRVARSCYRVDARRAQGHRALRTQRRTRRPPAASTRAPMPDRALVDAQVALVQVVRRPARRAGARAGPSRRGPGRGTSRSPRRRGSAGSATWPAVAEHRATAPARIAVGDRLVDHRRHAALVVDLRRARRTARTICVDQLRHQLRSRPRRPRRASGRCRRPGRGRGITLGAEPAWTTAPHHAHARRAGRAGGDRTAGSSVMTLASAKVRSPVRCGRRGVAAGAGRAGPRGGRRRW